MQRSPGLYPVIYAKDLNFKEDINDWEKPLREKILPKYICPGEPEHDLIGYLPEYLRPLVSLAYVYQ